MAYKTVSRSTLLKLLEVYEPDFLLFQYEIQPDFIFEKAFVALNSLFVSTRSRKKIVNEDQ